MSKIFCRAIQKVLVGQDWPAVTPGLMDGDGSLKVVVVGMGVCVGEV
jgi:hypothetical protein